MMKRSRRMHLRITSCVLVILLILSCFGTHSSITAANVKLSKQSLTLGVSSTYTLKLNNDAKPVQWSSTDEDIVIVSSKGKVTAIGEGNAKVTAMQGKKKVVCEVTVVPEVTTDDFVFYIGNEDKEQNNVTLYDIKDFSVSGILEDSPFGYAEIENDDFVAIFPRVIEKRTYKGIVAVYGYEKLNAIDKDDPFLMLAAKSECIPTQYVEYVPGTTDMKADFPILEKMALRFYFNQDGTMVGSAFGYDLMHMKWCSN